MNRQGLTIIEILMVVAIMALLLSLISPAYHYFQVSTRLNENTAQLIQALRLARQRSITGYHGTAHGVWLEVNGDLDRYIIYQGTSYATRDPVYDQITWLTNNVDWSFEDFILLNDDVDINFTTASGTPNNIGTIHLNYGGSVRNTMVNSSGLIEMN